MSLSTSLAEPSLAMVITVLVRVAYQSLSVLAEAGNSSGEMSTEFCSSDRWEGGGLDDVQSRSKSCSVMSSSVVDCVWWEETIWQNEWEPEVTLRQG